MNQESERIICWYFLTVCPSESSVGEATSPNIIHTDYLYDSLPCFSQHLCFVSLTGVGFILVQDGILALGNVLMRSTQLLKFPNCCF